jgi:2-C-methyl-D-erythritol 4-phosphate cytidylyltransferase
VVVAGGSASRFGRPKQFVTLAGKPVLWWSVAAARSACDGVVVVVPAGADGADGADPTADPAPDRTDRPTGDLPPVPDADPPWGADRVVTGGATRSDSVRAGLAAVPEDAAVIVVHDAARPLAPPALFGAVVAVVAAGDADGAIPVVPVTDTLKRVDGSEVVATVDREGLVAVQTPQAFAAAVLRRAHASGGEATDDAGLLEALGATVRTVAGDPVNLKLTHPADLAVAEALLPTPGVGR